MSSLGFSGNSQARLILARKNERADRLAGVKDQSGNFCGQLVTQVPDEKVEAGFGGNVLDRKITYAFVGAGVSFLFFAGEGADDFAVGVEEFEFGGIFGGFFQVVIKDCAGRRIFADGIAARIYVAFARAHGGVGSEEMRVFGGDRRAGLAEGAEVVENPERSAVRCDGESVIVNDHVVNRRKRKI